MSHLSSLPKYRAIEIKRRVFFETKVVAKTKIATSSPAISQPFISLSLHFRLQIRGAMPQPSTSSSHAPPPSPSTSAAPPDLSSQPLKITLLGPTSSGKTALRYRFIRGDFQKSYRATIGCDFLTRSIKLESKSQSQSGENQQEEVEVELQVWDTAGMSLRLSHLGERQSAELEGDGYLLGQERFKSISTPFFRGSQALILTFDYTTPIEQSLRELKMWFEEFRGKCDVVQERKEMEEWFCWVLVGCKMDLVQEEETKRIEKKIRKNVRGWFDQKEGEVLKAKDFSGASAKQNKVKTKLDIGPRSIPITKPVPFSPSSPPLANSTNSNSTITPSSKRPTLSTQSTSSTIASIELSSSLPTPQALNPMSLLLMATSPPRPPISVEPNGHPKAIYEGGPYNKNEGHLLENEQHLKEVDPEGEGEADESDEDEEVVNNEVGFEKDGFKFFRTSAKSSQGVEEVYVTFSCSL